MEVIIQTNNYYVILCLCACCQVVQTNTMYTTYLTVLWHSLLIHTLSLAAVTLPILGSYYGKPNKTIHLEYISCLGNEDDLTDCTKTQLSLQNGKLALFENDVAGVDCIYDDPTEPPCNGDAEINPGDACSSPGAFRLMLHGNLSTAEGRVEYCYNEFWTPLCAMDERVATVACRQLGHIQYSCKLINNRILKTYMFNYI